MDCVAEDLSCLMDDLKYVFINLRLLLSYGRLSGLPIPSYVDQPRSRMFQLYVTGVALFLFYKVICNLYAIAVVDKLEVRVYVIAILTYAFTGLFLLLFFALSGRRFLSLIRRSNQLTEKILNSGLGQEEFFIRHYLSAASMITKYANMMAVSSILCPVFFCVSVPLLDFIEGNYRTRTAVPGQCPQEVLLQRIPGVFEAIVLQQALAFFYPCTLRYVTECIMLALFKIQSGYFMYLSVALKGIGHGMQANGKSNQQFARWLQLHQEVTLHAFEVSSFFSPVIVMYYFSAISSIAGATLYILDSKSSNMLQSLFGGAAVFTMMCQLYLQCHVANEVTTEGEKIVFPVYSLPWPGLGRQSRKLITLILTMANQSVYIDGYRCPTFRLDKITFQSLFINTVSTFMAFRKIQDLSENGD